MPSRFQCNIEAGEGGESKAKSESERAADVESWTVPTVYGHCRYTEEEGERREALLNRLMNCGSVTDPSEARTKDDRPPTGLLVRLKKNEASRNNGRRLAAGMLIGDETIRSESDQFAFSLTDRLLSRPRANRTHRVPPLPFPPNKKKRIS